MLDVYPEGRTDPPCRPTASVNGSSAPRSTASPYSLNKRKDTCSLLQQNNLQIWYSFITAWSSNCLSNKVKDTNFIYEFHMGKLPSQVSYQVLSHREKYNTTKTGLNCHVKTLTKYIPCWQARLMILISRSTNNTL